MSTALGHSNADVERSLGIKKMMFPKKTLMHDETFIGLRSIKAAIKECGALGTGTVEEAAIGN